MVTIKTKTEAVQKMRVTKGFSLRKLSIQSGVNYVTISRMENGQTNPSPSTALKICNALETKFEELFEIVARPVLKDDEARELFPEVCFQEVV